MPNKEYIGDGVYADKDEFNRLVLTAENGIKTTNEIIFEIEVIIPLMNYILNNFYSPKHR